MIHLIKYIFAEICLSFKNVFLVELLDFRLRILLALMSISLYFALRILFLNDLPRNDIFRRFKCL